MEIVTGMPIIKKCPVCGSEDIKQKIKTMMGWGDSKDMIFGDGSFCGNCGVEFAFNSANLAGEIKREVAMIKRAREKAKRG